VIIECTKVLDKIENHDFVIFITLIGYPKNLNKIKTSFKVAGFQSNEN
jgi:hypothetical protein